jgi:ADP-ribose pyrophosphatase
MTSKIDSLGRGNWLELVRDGRWEFVRRVNVTGVVAMIAISDADEVVLVEQLRPALGRPCIEIPAGLVGDEDAGEDMLDAAKRELEEETGYKAAHWTRLFDGAASGGLTTEIITFYLARGLTKVSEGGGDGHEDITVHVVPLATLAEWLDRKASQGLAIDAKVYIAPWAAGRSV